MIKPRSNERFLAKGGRNGRPIRWAKSLVAGLVVLTAQAQAYDLSQAGEFLQEHCSRCHNDERYSGNWSLEEFDLASLAKGDELARWESILRVTQRGEMPPASRPQPEEAELADFLGWLTGGLDDYAAAHPNPGRATLRRLNRTEYNNAIRDLLALDIDIREQLPTDDTGYGFDNIADVLSVSPTLMDRYLAVAGKVSRLAAGLAPQQPYTTTFQLPKDGSILNQGVPAFDERMSNNLPLNSRGGGAFKFYAPYTGEYEISGYLNANTNNETDRLEQNRVSHSVHLSAGPHTLGMAFRRDLSLDESVQTLHNTTDIVVLPLHQPTMLTLDFIVDGERVGDTQVPSYYMSPRYAQNNFPRDVLQIDVEGPVSIVAEGETPSQKKIFQCQPRIWPFTAQRCASSIISTLANQAYRRSLDDADLAGLMGVYNTVAEAEGFEAGVAAAIQAILVSPSFLFLYEHDPADSAPGFVHSISDTEFAARLALFIWSSLPDEELLQLAQSNQLRKPGVLQNQLTRMLDDPKARALTENFAGQWLYLRNLEFHRADVVAYPDFDVPLRQAMLGESEEFFNYIVQQDRSVLDFLASNYTFLNERLAKHYGIDGVSGPALRKVNLTPQNNRGGLLGQGSILTVTSYGNHTSVVKRGKWILDNLLAAPPPPPPPDVPALVAKQGGKHLTQREQLALHSEDPSCSSCHVMMDPLGLALENFDAIGNYRSVDAGNAIDASATMPDGTNFDGISGLQAVLLARKTQFAEAFTQRLMIYALGRGLEAYDQPKLRAIVRAAQANDFRIRDIIYGIVTSEPFNYRRTPAA
ncbi:DUF1592 domain-containing protein [Halioxenophilus aromaticivorans]|uniref:DUF1592 domain-containing protein n=1 Tax=Halioxenophilus aromaticivorans TaxID=1306992 RepID=A0AAV3U4Q0_9ALTE